MTNKLKIGSLFSGYGGLDMAVTSLLDAEVVWHCEFANAPSKILEKNYPNIPNYGDIKTMDFTKVEPIDILTGGFPCQDLSHAGSRLGIQEGTRSGLWIEYARAIKELKPRMVFIENVRGLLSGKAYSNLESTEGFMVRNQSDPPLRAMGGLLGDLADLGYDAEWTSIRASDAGAPHRRSRIFIIAYPSART